MAPQGKKALLIIDVQNDFLPPRGALAVPNGNEVINPILNLMYSEKWDKIIMTRDWHTPDHTSFAKTHNLPDYSPYTYHSPVKGSQETEEATVWPVHCVQHTWGSQLAPELRVEQEKLGIQVVDKGYLPDREYYSAFHDIWGDHHTELDRTLREQDIKEVYIVGLALDFCVENTALSAAKLGYKTTILHDCCRAIHPGAASIATLRQKLAQNNVNWQ